MAEWLKAHAWKVCLRETVTRVRIPLSPPDTSRSILILLYIFHLAAIPHFFPHSARLQPLICRVVASELVFRFRSRGARILRFERYAASGGFMAPPDIGAACGCTNSAGRLFRRLRCTLIWSWKLPTAS